MRRLLNRLAKVSTILYMLGICSAIIGIIAIYVKAVGGQPVIECTTPEINLGSYIQGQEIAHRFRIINRGNDILDIIDIGNT